MQEVKKSWIARWGVVLVLALQIAIFSLRLTDPFIDGRFHVNWGPPFWLLKAQQMHQANFLKSYLGVTAEVVQTPSGSRATSWYSSHPQLIAIPLYIWTGLFGFSEWVVRSLAALCMLSATLLLWFALRYRHTTKQTMLFLFFFAALPVIINFGSKLDQEPIVMVAIALLFLGHERFIAGRERFPWTWTIATTLMLWSDWSGFIFGVLFFLAALLVQKTHPPTRKIVHGSIAGGVLGSGIVFVQTALELHERGHIMQSFVGLYKYRSNSTEPGFWYSWIHRQISFFALNFSGIIGLVGLISVVMSVGAALKKYAVAFKNGLTLGHLTALIGVGTFLYALIVPQATEIHVYYQIFYALPIAYGIMLAVEMFELYLRRHQQQIVIASVAVVLALAWSIHNGITNLYTDQVNAWGTKNEIELLKYVGTFKPEIVVTFIGDKGFNAWLDNPNIQYYAGRAIHIVEDPLGAAGSDWAMFGNAKESVVTQEVHELNKVTDKAYEFHLVKCSPLLCLAQRTKK